MTNTKKNTLTREMCIADFKEMRKLDLKVNVIAFSGVFVLYCFLCLIMSMAVGEGEWIGFVVISLPMLYILARVIYIAVEISDMEKGRFSIARDKVKGLGKGERLYEYGIRGTIEALKDDKIRLKRCVDYIYFWEHKRFIASRTLFDMASVDDEYYIVVLNRNKEKPRLVYSSKIYECQELDR